MKNKCGIDGVCVNTLGSFKCSCKQGYQNLMGNCIGRSYYRYTRFSL